LATAVFNVVKQIETEICWKEHQQHGSQSVRKPQPPNAKENANG
jgi:hypothetical protein